jgi:DNA-binding transcriptional LysR family regulator
LERGRAFVASLSGLNSGATSLATVEGLTVGPVADLLHDFWSRYPRIHVDLLSTSSIGAFKAIETSQAEIGLAYASGLAPKVKILAKAELAIGAIISSDHELAGKTSISLRELSATATPILLADASIGVRPILERAMGADAMRGLRRLTTNSTTLMNRLALGGKGVAIKSRVGLAMHIANGSIRFVPIKELESSSETLLLFSRLDSGLSPAGTALSQMLVPVVGQLN